MAPQQVAAPCLVDLRLKLLDATPLALPAGLDAALRAWLAGACGGARVASLRAAVRPGCTLLSVQAVLDAPGEGSGDSASLPQRGSAAALVAALLNSASGPVRSFFRTQRFSVAAAGEVADVAGGALLRVRPAPPPPRLPPLRPLALCSTADSRLASAQPLQAPAPGRLICRLHGQHLRLGDDAALTPGAPLSAKLPACNADGVAFFEAAPLAGGDDAALPATSRPVLLCRDAAVAAEVATLGDAIDAMPPGAAADAAAEAAERLVIALGFALRGGDECPPRLAAAALAAALTQGWSATVAALLHRAPPLSKSKRRSAAAMKGAETALHAAARCGRLEMLQAVLTHEAFASGRLGRAGSPAADGVTPLHLAATLRAPGAASAAVTALMEGDACAPLAWFAARDARGATPAQLAAAAAWDGADAAAAAMAQRLAAGRAAAAEACAAEAEALELEVPELVWEAALASLAATPGATAATARALLLAALNGAASPPSGASDNGEASDDEDVATEGAAVIAPAQPLLPRLARACTALARRSVGWEEVDASEREYVSFLARRNRTLVQVLSVLHVLQSGALCARMLQVLQSGAPNHPAYSLSAREGSGTFFDSHKLHDPRTGATVAPASLPHDALRLGVALFAPTVLLIRLPVTLLVARYAFSAAPALRAVYDRRFEALLCLTCCTEALSVLMFEAGVFALFGVVVEYPLNVALVHVMFNVVVHTLGPVRPQWNWPMWVIKALSQAGFISLFPSLWRNAWAFNSAVWLQQAASVLCVCYAWRRDAALRAKWRDEKQRAIEAKKLA